MNVRNKIDSIITNIIKIIFLFVIIFLFICVISTTCSVIGAYEKTLYNKDNILKNILVIVFSIIICKIISIIKLKLDKKKVESSYRILKRILKVVALIWITFTISWISLTLMFPRADQEEIINIVFNISQGIYSDFEKGAYMYIMPHQSGIVLLFGALEMFFGGNNFIAIQFLNIICLIISYYYIYKICQVIFKEKSKSSMLIIVISLFAYIQMAFYTTFIYGNILGLMFSVVGIYYELKFLQDEKISNLIISFISITLAVIIKLNYLITLIAMFLILIYEAIVKNKYKLFLFSVFLIICYLLGNKLVEITIENITHQELNKGTPKLAYIEMGLQEGGNKFTSGWFNGYNIIVFMQNDYDYEKTNNKVKEDLKKTLNEYLNDLHRFRKQITEKIVSQWAEPTFQCFWIAQHRISIESTPKIFEDIINEKGMLYNVLLEYMDIMQTIILFGSLLYIVMDFKNIEFKQLILAIVFIGGFFFHILWEAKCQYTITYFILLIPYAIIGYSVVIDKIMHKNSTENKEGVKK